MDIPEPVRQLVQAPEIAQAETKALEPVQNRFDILNAIFRALFVMISPRGAGVKINASVEVGKHGREEAGYKINPGVTVKDGVTERTGFWQVILVLVSNMDENEKKIAKCLAAAVKKIVRGENGGKISDDLLNRAERVLARFKANDPRWPAFVNDLQHFLQAPAKPKKGKAMVKVVLRGEKLPENEFYLPVTEPAFNGFRNFALEMGGSLFLVAGDVSLNGLQFGEFKELAGHEPGETVAIGFNEDGSADFSEAEAAVA